MTAVVSGLDKVSPLPKTNKLRTRSQVRNLVCPMMKNFRHGTKCDALSNGYLESVLSYEVMYLRFVYS